MNPIENKALHRLNDALKKELEKVSKLVAEHSALSFDTARIFETKRYTNTVCH